MKKSLRKIITLSVMKLKANFANKMTLISPLFAIGMVVVLDMSIKMNGVDEVPSELKGMILNMGLLMNFMMTGVVSVSTLLSEEKEKHTLRSLLTSSISGTEFFLGSLLPNVLLIMVVNVILLFVSPLPISQVNIPIYLFLTFVGSVISVILGIFVGIFAKNQMSASMLSMPVMLIICSGSFVAGFAPGIKKVTRYLYTEMISGMASAFAAGGSYNITLTNFAMLILQMLLLTGFVYLIYQKNGFEKE